MYNRIMISVFIVLFGIFFIFISCSDVFELLTSDVECVEASFDSSESYSVTNLRRNSTSKADRTTVETRYNYTWIYEFNSTSYNLVEGSCISYEPDVYKRIVLVDKNNPERAWLASSKSEYVKERIGSIIVISFITLVLVIVFNLALSSKFYKRKEK